jgi:DNA-binding XRE family transcriptional regulator
LTIFFSAPDCTRCNIAGAETFPSEFAGRLISSEHQLKVWREYRAFTLADLGQICGVSAPALSQIEKRKRSPSVELLGRLAKALNCDMDDLLSEKEEI